jgi:hypothetical protein
MIPGPAIEKEGKDYEKKNEPVSTAIFIRFSFIAGHAAEGE